MKKLKTDGAWFRVNKWLRNLRDDPDETFSGFLMGLKSDPGLLAATLVFRGVMADTLALNGEDFNAQCTGLNQPASTETQLAVWIENGIPRQVWNGIQTNPRYEKVMPGDEYPPGYLDDDDQLIVNTKTVPVFIPIGAPFWRTAAHDLRRIMDAQRRNLKMIVDVANKTRNRRLNPGGVADATKPSEEV